MQRLLQWGDAEAHAVPAVAMEGPQEAGKGKPSPRLAAVAAAARAAVTPSVTVRRRPCGGRRSPPGPVPGLGGQACAAEDSSAQ